MVLVEITKYNFIYNAISRIIIIWTSCPTFDEDALWVDGESVEVLGSDGLRPVDEAHEERVQLVTGDVGALPVKVQPEVHGHAPLADAVQRQHLAADESGVVLRPSDQQVEQLLVGARLLAVLGRVGVHQRRLERVARQHAQVGAERQQRHFLVGHHWLIWKNDYCKIE